MNKLSYAAQQAKLQKDIEKLQKQASMLQAKRRRPILAGIIKSMKEYDLIVKEAEDDLPNAPDPLGEPGR